MRWGIAVAWALTVCGSAAAQDPPAVGAPPEATPPKARDRATRGDLENAVARTRAAWRARDTGGISSSASGVVDPWLIADELLAQGELDAALALAAAMESPASTSLTAYLASRRGLKETQSSRSAVRAMAAAIDARSWPEVLEATKDIADTSPVVHVRLLSGRGFALLHLDRTSEGEDALLAASDLAMKLGWGAKASVTLGYATRSRTARGTDAEVLPLWDRLVSIAVSRDSWAEAGTTAERAAWTPSSPEAFDRARRVLAQVIDARTRLQDRLGVAQALRWIGWLDVQQRDLDGALRAYGQAVEAYQGVDGGRRIAAVLVRMGELRKRNGEYRTALLLYEQASERLAAGGEPRRRLQVLEKTGFLQKSSGRIADAKATYATLLELARRMRDDTWITKATCGMGACHVDQGDPDAGLSLLREALGRSEQAHDEDGVLDAVLAMGVAHAARGAYAEAISCDERGLALARALGQDTTQGLLLSNLGVVYLDLGEPGRAIPLLRQSLQIAEREGDRIGMARVTGNIGLAHQQLGELDEALVQQTRALDLRLALDLHRDAAITRRNIARILGKRKQYAQAMESYRLAMETSVRIGAKELHVWLLQDQADVYRAQSRLLDAMSTYQEALTISERADLASGQVRSLGALARINLEKGYWSEAARLAHRAVEVASGSVRALSSEEQSRVRERHFYLYAIGASAAIEENDLQELAYFLEACRARALLEAMEGSAALWSAALPPELYAAERAVRNKEASVSLELTAAEVGGVISTMAPIRKRLEAARAERLQLLDRLHREARLGANLVDPRPESLEALQEGLKSDEILLIYTVATDRTGVLLVRRDGARFVRLALEGALRPLCDPSSWGDRPAPPIDALRASLATPLGLPEEVTRVFVSPEGFLCGVPFSLLWPEREVTCVPSGTMLRMLRGFEGRQGEGVLAVGDPDYETVPSTSAGEVTSRRRSLPRLQRSGDEARAVGSKVLVRADASEKALVEALPLRGRWRSVHLACHALVDSEHPLLSSLELTPSGADDGHLTALEVLGLKVPTDLAVLSACDSARGRVYEGEGILGLTHAFFAAGAPRVLCSLWRADDRATEALMKRFYDLWNPNDGSEGLSTTAALRAAQESVRVHPGWSHPYYWAGWVLWGLPD